MEENQQQETSSRSGVKSFLTYRLSRLHYNLDAHAQAILKKHTKLSLIEWRIISLINHESETTMPDILVASRISEDELNSNLQNLIQKSYVLSAPSLVAEGAEVLSLSMEGQDLYHDLLPYLVIRQTQLSAQLSPAEINALDSILDKLDKAAVGMRDGVI